MSALIRPQIGLHSKPNSFPAVPPALLFSNQSQGGMLVTVACLIEVDDFKPQCNRWSYENSRMDYDGAF